MSLIAAMSRECVIGTCIQTDILHLCLQQYWYIPTQRIEGQGPKHSSDLRAGSQRPSHCFVGYL